MLHICNYIHVVCVCRFLLLYIYRYIHTYVYVLCINRDDEQNMLQIWSIQANKYHIIVYIECKQACALWLMSDIVAELKMGRDK